MTKRLHVGILGAGLIEWGGGTDLLRIVLGALDLCAANCPLKLTLFLPQVSPPVSSVARLRALSQAMLSLRPFQGLKRFYWDLCAISPPEAERRRLLQHLLPPDAMIESVSYVDMADLRSLVRRSHVDAVLPSILDLGSDFPVPWAGYIPDFQHKHLPHMFDAAELQLRDQNFTAMLRHAPAMIATSEAVRRDMEAFPVARDTGMMVVLPFAPYPQREWFDPIEDDVGGLYDLPERFFIVSSQFWRHKSHITAIRALARLTSDPEFADVRLVCTGATHDYRHPGFFDDLLRHIDSMGLSTAVQILGHIPKRHQIEILKRAVALVQPTLFEGTQGGLAVFDAVGLGLRAIVSDIPVNAEIDDPLVRFFPPEDEITLAELMRDTLVETPPVILPSHQMELSRRRMVALGLELIRATNLLLGREAPSAARSARAVLQA